jgi:hypothetical protein
MKPDSIPGESGDSGDPGHPGDTDHAFGQQLRRALRELHDAPEALQRQAIALWPVATAAAAAPARQPLAGLAGSAAQLAGGALRHVAAVLSFDSWAAPAVALGMRGQRVATRHLLFNAEGRDIDLRIAPSPPVAAGMAPVSFALSGQILGPDDSGELELARAGGPATQRTALDAMGEFRLDDLAPGLYTLTLRLGDEQIVLPGLQVGPQPDGAAG